MTPTRGQKSFRFARSISVGLVGQGAALAVNLVATPVLIHAFGTQTYGLYLLMFTVTNHILLGTLGAGAVVTRQVTDFSAGRDGRALRRTLAYASAFYGAVAALGASVGWGLAPWVARAVLRIEGVAAEEVVFVLRAASCASAALVFMELVLSALQGMQRFGWQAVASLLQYTGFLAAAAALAQSGRDIHSIAVLFAGWSFALSTVGLGLVWRCARDVPDEGSGRPSLSGFLRYGLGGGLSRFSWIVITQFDRVYLARVASLAAVTIYSVPAGLLQRMQVVRSLVSNALIPMMGELRGESQRGELRRIYLKSNRFVLWITLPVLVGLFALMPQFLGLWLGGDFASKGVWPVRLLILAQVLYFLEGQAHVVIFTCDKPWHLTALIWLQAVASVVGWKLLAGRFGILGVAAGSLAAQTLAALCAITYSHRKLLALSWSDYARGALYAPGVSALLALAVVFPWRAEVVSWPRLVLAVTALLVTYYASTWFFMDDDDRGLLKAYLGRLASDSSR